MGLTTTLTWGWLVRALVLVIVIRLVTIRWLLVIASGWLVSSRVCTVVVIAGRGRLVMCRRCATAWYRVGVGITSIGGVVAVVSGGTVLPVMLVTATVPLLLRTG